MVGSRKCGHEASACISGSLRIVLSLVSVLFLACSPRSDSGPVAPRAVSADVFSDPPLPGHALIFSFAAGTMMLVTGEAVAATPGESICGVPVAFHQRIGFLSSPADPRDGGVGPPKSLTTPTTALIPHGSYQPTFVAYCSSYNIYDVDFSGR